MINKLLLGYAKPPNKATAKPKLFCTNLAIESIKPPPVCAPVNRSCNSVRLAPENTACLISNQQACVVAAAMPVQQRQEKMACCAGKQPIWLFGLAFLLGALPPARRLSYGLALL